MAIQDFKSKDTYRTLGLRKGKGAFKRETSSPMPKRVFIWLGLFAIVALVNYFVFVHLEPIGQKGPKPRDIFRGHKRADTFAEWFDTGCKRYQVGDLEGAIEAYTEAIALKPGEIRPYFKRGIVYMDLHIHDKAIDDYNTVIGMNPDYSEAYHNRGWACLQNGLFDQTIRDCTKALTLDPHMARAYRTRGLAYKRKGMLEKAKKDLHKGCKLGDAHGCRLYEGLLKNGES